MQLSLSQTPKSISSANYLLRQYGGAAAAYSLQRLDTSTTNVVRARRSTDDAESNFTAEEVSGGSLREFALNNDADLIRFADQAAAADKRMYFDGSDDYVVVSGMTASASYFGACTISGTIRPEDKSATAAICALGDAAYRVLIVGGKWAINLTVTTVDVGDGLLDFEVDFDSSGNGVAIRVNGATVWTGSAPAPGGVGGDGTKFNIGRRDAAAYWKGLIYDFSLSGSAVKNFSFNGYGNTDADWEDQVGSNDGTVNGSPALFSGQGFDAYVTTLYDQSGNGRNATQATAASQPQIVADGVVVTDSNGVPSMIFDGTDDELVTTTITAITGNIDHTAFCVFERLSTQAKFNAALSIGWGASGTNGTSVLGQNTSGNFWAGGDDLVSPAGGAITNNVPLLGSKTHISGTTIGYKDGSSIGTAANTYSLAAANQFIALGSYDTAVAHTLNAKISEAIVYLSDKSANRTAIEANIASRYGIPLA